MLANYEVTNFNFHKIFHKVVFKAQLLTSATNHAYSPQVRHSSIHLPPELSAFFLACKKPDVLEKYLAFASATRFSAACGLTISRPWRGVNATLDAVPDVAPRTVDLPPYVA